MERLADEGQPGEDERRDGCRAVAADEVELVGQLETLGGHEVRHRRVLGRVPEKRDALDEDDRDVHPPQLADERDRHEERETEQVSEDHRLAPVEAVGDDAGDRAEDDRGGDAEDEDP